MKQHGYRFQTHSHWKLFMTVAGLWTLAAVSALVAAAQAESTFKHDISLDEIMASIIMPAADELWSAVSVNMTLNGEEINQPQTDEEWLELRYSAVRLAAATNLLLVPETPVVPADNPGEVGAGELAPEQIADLLKSQWPAWSAHVEVLHGVSMKLLQAVDARNPQAISDIGGALDEACESCHLQFWYPNQQSLYSSQ